MNKTEVAFVIYDYDGNFNQLTDFLGLTPTLATEADLVGHGVRRWELASGAPQSEELETHLGALLAKLTPRASQIHEIAQKYRCVITVGVKYHEYNPEIVLTPQVLSDLTSLGVKLWLDIYNEWDGETEHDYDHEVSKL